MATERIEAAVRKKRDFGGQEAARLDSGGMQAISGIRDTLHHLFR
jgi:hypothetical protein